MPEAERAEPIRAEVEPALPPRLVLFDGFCAFCDRAVRWLLERDPSGRLRFATLQGPVAARLRARHPEIPDGIDTMVYVESGRGGERVHLRSDAAFRILAELEGPWRHLARLRALPRGLTDAAYRLFVRVRYRVFGKLSECRVPTPAERERFFGDVG